MASVKEPVDLGECCKCVKCDMRFCICPERKPDGSLQHLQQGFIEVKTFVSSKWDREHYLTPEAMKQLAEQMVGKPLIIRHPFPRPVVIGEVVKVENKELGLSVTLKVNEKEAVDFGFVTRETFLKEARYE